MGHINHPHAFKSEDALVGAGEVERAAKRAMHGVKLADKGKGGHFTGVGQATAGITVSGTERGSHTNASKVVPHVAARKMGPFMGEAEPPEAAGKALSWVSANWPSTARAHG